MLLVLGIVLFLGLVITHELGHFLVAKRNGVTPEEFGIFFPPTLYRRKMKSGWDFTLNLLPLGGFVKLKGEHDSDTEPGSFGAATDWVKAKIMLAGVAVNFLTAFLLFTVLALAGMPKIIDNQFTIKSDTVVSKQEVRVGYIEPHSPAEKAGLTSQDTITSISLQSEPKTTYVVKSAASLKVATHALAGKAVMIHYLRNGEPKATNVVLRSSTEVTASQKSATQKGYLGVVPQELTLQRSTWSAPIVALGLSAQLTELTLKGLWHALQGLGGIIAGAVTGNTYARERAQTTASSQVSGPLGIFFVLKGGSALGLLFILFIIAIISLTLAIMNVLPIPALDGGRLYLMLASRLTGKKRLTPVIEERIVGASFVALLVLIVLITLVDVKRFF